MPTILLKKSDTASSVPTTSQLTNLAGGAEVAVNTADRRMYTMTSASAVVELGNNPTSLNISTGNLAFTGTAQRITGDMSNATASSRLSFQSSTTNGNTILQAIPNGTATQTNLLLYANTDLANTAALNIFQNATESTVRGIALGTGSYTPMTFYTGGSERMRIDTSGNVGIGGTASAFDRVTVTGTLPSSSGFSIGFGSRGTIPSTSTSLGIGFSSVPNTQAASFTLSGLTGFYAGQGTFGAGSTVTNQYGYYAENNLTGATNNFGFYSNIASGANRFNFYANGTADNYFAGNVGIGTASPSYRLHVDSTSGAAIKVATGGFNWLNLISGYTGNLSIGLNDSGGSGALGVNQYNSSGSFVRTAIAIDSAGKISDQYGNIRAIPRVGSAKTSVYTLSISDVGQYVELGTGGGVDVPNGIFSTGDVVSVFNNTTGNRTISLTITTAYIAGTDADKNSVTLATRGVATVLFISNSVCVLSGNVT